MRWAGAVHSDGEVVTEVRAASVVFGALVESGELVGVVGERDAGEEIGAEDVVDRALASVRAVGVDARVGAAAVFVSAFVLVCVRVKETGKLR